MKRILLFSEKVELLGINIYSVKAKSTLGVLELVKLRVKNINLH